MRLRKLINYEPKRWYIIKMGEKNGIKIGSCIEEADIKAEYTSVGKREQKQLEPFLEGKELENMRAGHVFTMERKSKRFNLATIYYREDASTDLLPVVVDVHYHLSRNSNGYRDEKDLIKTVEDMLVSFAYKKDLVVGGYGCKKKHINRKTKGAKHQKKVYTKVE